MQAETLNQNKPDEKIPFSIKGWFTVELIFLNDMAVETFRFANCKWDTTKSLQAQIVDTGFRLPTSADTWIVIFPWNVKAFRIVRQETFFKNTVSDLKRTVFTAEQKISV